MKKHLALTLLFLLTATLAFAHAGEVHTYMGTVTDVHADGSFMLKKTDGETIHVAVNNATRYLRADNKSASAADLKPGTRAVVKISTDGKTAMTVKMSATKTK
jgi:hypothetical protein